MRALLRVLLLAFAVLATVGHICVLPGHTHAATVDTSEDEHDRHDSDESDVGSCEVLRPPAVTVDPVTAVAAVLQSDTAAVLSQTFLSPVRAVPRALATSPPLYLTHRAFRI